MAFTTNYRNIIIKQFKLEKFIIKFKSGLIELNNPIDVIKDTIIDLKSTVNDQNIKLNEIELKLNNICQLYGINQEKYNKIKSGIYNIKFKNRWRRVKINEDNLYINHGRNDKETYVLKKGDI